MYETGLDLAPGLEETELTPTHTVGQSFTNYGALAAKVANQGLANFAGSLDQIISMAADQFGFSGIPKPQLMAEAREELTRHANYWSSLVQNPQWIEQAVGTMVGGTPQGMAEFSLGVPYAALSGYAKGGVKGMLESGIKRSILGEILKASNQLAPAPKAAANFGVGTAQARAEGADWPEALKEGAIQAGMGLVEPAGQLGAREALRQGKTSLVQDIESLPHGMGRPLLNEAGITRVGFGQLEKPSLDWGDKPPQEAQFEHDLKPLEGLRSQLVESDRLWGLTASNSGNRMADNPTARELTAAYRDGVVDLNKAYDTFIRNMNADETGSSIFGAIWNRELEYNRAKVLAGKEPYSALKVDIANPKSFGSNSKAAGEILPFDLSRGCLGMCTGCYACQGMSGMSKKFVFPTQVNLTGNFKDMITKNKSSLYRIGENGEPGFDAQKWIDSGGAAKLETMLKNGESIGPDQLLQMADHAYDWSWFNEQVKKTGLGSELGREHYYVITKLNSLKNFDPSLVKNVQVSVDPGNPVHFFNTLKNVEQLQQMAPDISISLRVRSVASYSDEINALQRMAVDFANSHNLPVLETRVRFKNDKSMNEYMVHPEYWEKDRIGQKMHLSYWPSIKDPASTHELVSDRQWTMTAPDAYSSGAKVYSYDLRTTTGKEPTDVYITAPSWGTSQQKRHTVWVGDKAIGNGLDLKDAKDLAAIAVNQNSRMPGMPEVREFSLQNSPLSQMGLRPDLHYQCNTFNIGGNACSSCKACRSLVNIGKAKRMEAKP